MKKAALTSLIIAIAAVTAGVLTYGQREAEAAVNPDPAVFFVAHQDDETLVFGSAIDQHVKAGRDVHVILFGRGDGTAVRTSKMPALLGYTPTREEIGYVRDKEFQRAVQRLGVLNYHYDPYLERLPEKGGSERGMTGWTAAEVEVLMRKWLKKFPNMDPKTHSYADSNPDHSAMGLALRNIRKSGALKHAPRYYVAPWLKGKISHPAVTAERSRTWNVAFVQEYYRKEDIKNGLWGVGYKSVRSYFDYQLNQDPVSWRHS